MFLVLPHREVIQFQTELFSETNPVNFLSKLDIISFWFKTSIFIKDDFVQVTVKKC